MGTIGHTRIDKEFDPDNGRRMPFQTRARLWVTGWQDVGYAYSARLEFGGYEMPRVSVSVAYWTMRSGAINVQPLVTAAGCVSRVWHRRSRHWLIIIRMAVDVGPERRRFGAVVALFKATW